MLSRVLEQIKSRVGAEITDSRSPAGNWLKPRLESIEKGKATISVPVRAEMCNPFGNIHGGMMSLIIDEAIGWAVVSLEADSFYTSISLNVDFLYAAQMGERVFAMAKVLRHGKKVINTEVEVYNAGGTLLAKAASNLVVTGMRPQNVE